MIKQRTLEYTISVTGKGVHSNEYCYLTLKPAPANTGIIFKRVDKNNKEILAKVTNICSESYSTDLKVEGVKVATIEHLMSALSGLGIDNVLVELDNDEVPILDGSAARFVSVIQGAGIKELEENKCFFVIEKEVMVQDGDKWAKVIPFNGYKLNIEIDFLDPAIKNTMQKLSIDLKHSSYVQSISRARTFGWQDTLKILQKNNRAKGSDAKNSIAIDKDGYISNKEVIRYEKDEFARHKILDVIGDLYLLGNNILCEYQAYKPGHSLTHKLLRKILEKEDNWSYKSFHKNNSPISFYGPYLYG